MKNTQQSARWILATLFSLALTITACTAADVESNVGMKSIACTLHVDASVSQGAEVLVTFSLKNQTETVLQILQYHTPLEDLVGPVFELRFEEELLNYQGRMVKRGPPTSEDWLQVKPSDSLVNELDISDAWSLNKKGSYSLRLSQDVSYRIAGSAEVLSMSADNCPVVTFQIK